ncbi:hypothetical protein B296_00017559 [Ensete ventricosum]|uniref:Uncharacterized protein n=1 Tax=Ensete ventricosum TaxID=4639 RepID=A0A427AJI0_ENSVE|nr:hypothetical protein B296_00017559 [Ensete ventricosum]
MYASREKRSYHRQEARSGAYGVRRRKRPATGLRRSALRRGKRSLRSAVITNPPEGYQAIDWSQNCSNADAIMKRR